MKDAGQLMPAQVVLRRLLDEMVPCMRVWPVVCRSMSV
jgi:hypothetical protein